MTGADLITEFLADQRFGQSRARVLGFLNARYGEMLALEEWAFLESSAQMVLDSAIESGPADLGVPTRLYLNTDGTPLTYLTFADFQNAYLGTNYTGRPTAFALDGSASPGGTQFFIGPTPDTAYAATLLYNIDPVPLVDGAVSPVSPWWSHEGLVAGAQAFALELENDPTAGPLEDRFQRVLDAMRRRCLVIGRGPAQQMPRDPLLR